MDRVSHDLRGEWPQRFRVFEIQRGSESKLSHMLIKVDFTNPYLDKLQNEVFDISPVVGLIFSMRVISIKKIKDYYEGTQGSEQALKSWLDEARKADWKTPEDIKDRYSHASILSNNRVVFNIKGNDYRLVVAVAYQFGAVYVKFIGTHAEYDKIDAKTVED